MQTLLDSPSFRLGWVVIFFPELSPISLYPLSELCRQNRRGIPAKDPQVKVAGEIFLKPWSPSWGQNRSEFDSLGPAKLCAQPKATGALAAPEASLLKVEEPGEEGGEAPAFGCWSASCWYCWLFFWALAKWILLANTRDASLRIRLCAGRVKSLPSKSQHFWSQPLAHFNTELENKSGWVTEAVVDACSKARIPKRRFHTLHPFYRWGIQSPAGRN